MLTFFIVIVLFAVWTYLFVEYENEQKRKQSMATMRESIDQLDIFDTQDPHDDFPSDEENNEAFYIITKTNPEGYITVIPYGSINEYLDLCESLRIEVYECVYLGEL